MQSRCVQLARMGCVVFHYDMIGYADCTQLSEELVHRFSGTRKKYPEPPEVGFYSAAAESRLQNVMGLHTLNSIRALDFLTSLPDVDPTRIAVTGGSGGGTQTYMLCAVDDRPLVSVPVVIVSTTRQGGCTCENICGLRVGTYNLEFTALHAPKPLMPVSADDATRTLADHGYPELQQLYKVLGQPDHVAHTVLLHFPHNYNAVSRTAMYHFVNKHLKLGLKEPIIESDYQLLTPDQLTVWDADHPKPTGGRAFELALLKWLSDDSDRQLAGLAPRDLALPARYRDVVGGAWDILLRGGNASRNTTAPRFESVRTMDQPTHRRTLGLLRYRTPEGDDAELPTIVLTPKQPHGGAVVWVTGKGKSGLYQSDGTLLPAVATLLAEGREVIGVDLFDQGEFLADDAVPPTRQRWLAGEEGHCGWTYCYNLPVFAKRVNDVAAALVSARSRDKAHHVSVVGVDGAGLCAAAAVALMHDQIDRAAIDTQGFRFASVADVYGIDFIPGAVKYGDVPSLLALAAPTKLCLAGEKDGAAAMTAAAYRAAGDANGVTVFGGAVDGVADAAARWLLQQGP
jgi:dienelactone hydrolase